LVTITWAFWGASQEVDINEQIIEVFEGDYPYIRVETVHRSRDVYFKELRSKFETGESVPDVLLWSQAPIDIPNGYFMNLAPMIEAENYSLRDFLPGLLTHFQVGDGIYGLPRNSDVMVIFYNKRLFNRADLPYPEKGWTWDDLRAIALALKKAGVADYSLAYEVNDWWMIWMWQNGVQIFDDKLFPTQTGFDDPAAAEAIQFFADLTKIDQVTPPYEVLRNSEEIVGLFKEGKLAMAFGNHAWVPVFAKIKDFEWDVVGLPHQKRRANLAAGAGYVIAANTRHPDAAWTFLKFLTGPKGQALLAESGIAMPARRSVVRSEIFMEQPPAHNAQVFLDEAEIGQPGPAFLGVNDIFKIVDEEILEPVWRGEREAASALQAVLPEIERIITENQPPAR
jgi:multiple sugar transport system substrate-binding protein